MGQSTSLFFYTNYETTLRQNLYQPKIVCNEGQIKYFFYDTLFKFKRGSNCFISVRFTVFSIAFNNISVISWRSVLLVEYLEKTTDLPQVIDKLYHIMLY